MRNRHLAVISLVIIFTFSERSFAWQNPVANLEADPVISCIYDTSVTVTFDGSGSYHPGYPDSYIVEYRFDCDGDSTYDFTEYPEDDKIVEYEYTEPGTYLAQLQVEDNEELIDDDSCYIYVYKKYGPIYVDKNVNTSDPCYTGEGDSWANAYQELSDAIADANGGALIYVAEGKYLPTDDSSRSATFELKPYMEIYGGFPKGGCDFEDRNPVTEQTILSGDIGTENDANDNSYHVVKGADNTLLDGFTITAGDANSTGWNGKGSGMYNGGCSPTIRNCIFTGNFSFYGGGMYNYQSDPNLINCVFSLNSTKYLGRGGGMTNEQSDPNLINCVFSQNFTLTGGGIWNTYSCPLLINCTFSKNDAHYGCGMANTHYSEPVVINSIFWGDESDSYGEIYNYISSCPKFSYCDIQDSNGSGEGNWYEYLGEDLGGNIDSDPKFADSSEPDGKDGKFLTEDDGLQLQCYLNNSSDYNPCIDAGDDSVGIETDILGRGRVDVPYITGAGTYDMGAYESRVIFYVDSDVSGGNEDGSSWDNAFPELYDEYNEERPGALYDSNVQDGGELWVAAGTYKPTEGTDRSSAFQLLEGVDVYGGFGGTEKLLTDRNWNENLTTLSGDIGTVDDANDNSYHVVRGANDTILDGFTVTAGYADGDGDGENCGGGFYSADINELLIVRNCRVISNFAESFGAGAYNEQIESILIESCVFEDNNCNGCGGGSYNYMSNPRFADCVFKRNSAVGTSGAVHNVFSDTYFVNCEFTGNIDKGMLPEIVAEVNVAEVFPTWYWEEGWGGEHAGEYIQIDPNSITLPDYNNREEYQIRWGYSGGTQSGLGFAGATPPDITINVNEPFEIGQLRHFNNEIGSGTEVNQVELTIDLDFVEPLDFNQSFEFMLDVNGLDYTNPHSNDIITFPTSYPYALIEIEKRAYTLEIIGFGPDANNLLSEFVSPKGETNAALLWARIVPPPVNGAMNNLASNVELYNCLFVGNSSGGSGGALGNWSCEQVLLANCTIADNNSVCGGGIYNRESNVDIANSILWDNNDIDSNSILDKQIYNINTDCNVSYSCIQDDTAGFEPYPFGGMANHNIDAEPLFVQDPNPGVDGQWDWICDDYGDLGLQQESPCIDAADSNALPAGIVCDLDGNNRFIDEPNTANTGNGEPNFLDMGAYEFGSQVPPVANDDNYIVGRNSELVVGEEDGVLANDYDDNGDEMIAELVEGTFYGELSFNNADGSFTYEPPIDFYGTDDFQYKVIDSKGLYSNTATVTIDTVYLQVFAGDDNDITIQSNPVQMQLSEAYVLPEGMDVSWSVELEYLGTVDFVNSPNTLNPEIEITVDVNKLSDESVAEFVLLITAENEFDSVSDDIVITVRNGMNSGPYVEAGEYEPITLPHRNYVDLKGMVEDDGLPCDQIYSHWFVISYPPDGGTVGFGDASSLETRATFDREGQYVLKLWASDTNLSNYDIAVIDVNYDPAANHPPTANAGDYRVVILNGSQVDCQLSDACAVDLDGDELSILWTVVGPSGGASFDPTVEKPVITFTKHGLYIFTMEVSDVVSDHNDNVDILVKPSLFVDAGANKSEALPESNSIDIYFEDANAKKLTIPYDHLDIEWSLAANSPNSTGIDFNGQEGLENPTFTFTEKGSFKLELTAVDEDINEPTNNSKSDVVWVSVYGANEVQEKYREKVFVLPEFDPPNDFDNGRLGFLSYYPEDDDTIVFDEELVFSDDANQIYYNTIDMAFDKESGYLFISSILYNANWANTIYGIIYVNEAAREFVFDETQHSEQFIPTPHKVAGIAFDNIKAEPKLYVLENITADSHSSHNLFVYVWDADKERLIFEDVVPLGFFDYDSEKVSEARRTDLAFDNKTGILYVTFGGEEEASMGETDIVYGYDTNDWGIERRIKTDDAEENVYAAYFIDVYNDGKYTYLYTADWCGSYLARTKINNDGDVIERATKDIREDHDIHIYGIGADEQTGHVWITTEGQIRVYDGLCDDWDTNEPLAFYDSNIDELEIKDLPRSIIADSTKKDFDQGSNKAVTKDALVENGEELVSPVDEYRNEITYEITYHIYYAAQNVFIEDILTKGVDFINATGPWEYDPVTRKVSWYLGSVSENDTDTFKIDVRVNKNAEIGGEISNLCKIESNSRIAYSEPVKTKVDWWARRLYVDVNAPEGGDGVSWETAYQTLQDALYAAEQAEGAIEEIWVAAGTYSPGCYENFSFGMIDGVDLYGGFAGTEKNIDERDFADANNETILSGLNSQGDRFNTYVVEAANDLIVDGFTITGASDSDILCDNSYTYVNITISNCNITNSYYGIDANSVSGWEKLQIIDCSVSDNKRGIYSDSSSPIISGCKIMHNDDFGIYLDEAGYYGPAIIENCWIYKNGIDGIYTRGSAYAEVYNNTIVRNGSDQCLYGEGYGINCSDGVYYFDINNCIVWDNLQEGQLYYCSAGYSYVGDSSLADPFVDSANDNYHLRDDFAGCIDKGNRIITETTEPKTTTEIVVAAEIFAEDPEAFLEGDVIEIANDGIPRIVTGVDDNTITFNPALDSNSTAGLEVINWKVTDSFKDIVGEDQLTLESVKVKNASVYRENDVLYIVTKYQSYTEDEFYGTVTDVNIYNNTVYFTTDYNVSPCSYCTVRIDCYRLADNFDIDGEQRILRGRVDIGADEYSPVQVYAGENKEETICVIVGNAEVRINDAAVIVKDGSISNLTVQWSCIDKTDGFSFNGQQAALNPTLTFTEVGDYLFKLEARDDAGSLGADFVRVRVNLGMTLTSVPAEAAIGQTATITAGNFANEEPYKIDWHCSDGAIFNPTESFISNDYKTDVVFANGMGIYRIKGVAYDSNDNYLGEEQIWMTVDYPHIITDAGCDYEITWPDNRAYLNGSIAGAVPEYFEWIADEKLQEYVTFDEVTSLTLQSFADFAEPGLYRIGLVAREQDSQESDIVGVDVVNIKVNPAARGIVYAGEDVQITKPQDEAFLTGWVEGDCTDCSYEWSFDGETSLVDINTQTLTHTRVDFNDVNDNGEPEAGVYRFIFSVTDANSYEVGRDAVLVMLTDANFSSATVQAGADQQVSINSDGYAFATLTGEVSAPGDTSVKWYASSDEVWFLDEIDNAEQVTAIFENAGEYPFAFEVRDENGDVIGIDTVTVSVKSFDGRDIYVDAVSSPNEITFLVDDYMVLGVNEVGEDNYDSGQWLIEAGHSELADLVNFSDEDGFFAAAFGRPGIYTIAFQLLNEDLIVGQDYVQVKVNFPQNIVDAKVVIDGDEYKDVHCVYLIDDEVSEDLIALVSGVGDTSVLSYQWSPADNLNNANIQSPTATFDEAGIYVYKVEVKYGLDFIGADSVKIIVVSDAPIVDPGSYPTVRKWQVLPLDKAKVWCMDGRTISSYLWTSNPDGCVKFVPKGEDDESSAELNPTVTFGCERPYWLTLAATDDANASGSGMVRIDVQNPVVYAGRPKKTIPFASLYLYDARVKSASDDLTYQWVASPNATNVFFEPSADVVNPDVMFIEALDEPYRLTLTVYDGQGDLGSDTVEITVKDYFAPDDGSAVSVDINTTPEVSGYYCGEFEVTVTAEDEHLALYYLEMDGQRLRPYDVQVMRGSYDSPQKIQLSYKINTHSIDTGSHSLMAKAYERSGDVAIDTVDFSNTCEIYNFTVTPDCITEPEQTLTFDANFVTSDSWTLKVIDTNYITDSGENQFPITVDLNDLGSPGNGTYEAKLTADGEEASVYFDVALDLRRDDLVAEINDLLKVYKGDFDIPSEKPIITEGLYDLYIKAYHPAFNDDVRCKVILEGESLYKNITPGCLDEQGYRKGYFGNESVYGLLGELDFTSVPNGAYTLELVVNCHNLIRRDTAEIAVSNNLKIGNLKFSQQDMVIPVAGIPISVVRTYDSFDRDKKSDFGFGWTYTLANMDIQLHEPRDEFDRDVTLTLPDGQRVTFVSSLYGGAGNYDREWKLEYSAPEGVTAFLETKRDETLVYRLVNGLNAALFWYGYTPPVPGSVDFSKHDVSGYELTLDDGTVYHIERGGETIHEVIGECFGEDDVYYYGVMYSYVSYGKPYLSYISLPSGEIIFFDVNDSDRDNPRTEFVKHYQSVADWDANNPTKSIKLVRDDSRHPDLISKIFAPGDDPNLPSLKYEYDIPGNLVSVKKLVDKEASTEDEQYEITTYVYDDITHYPRDHFVTDITDERGLSPIRYVYDDQGRLTGTIDARGNAIEIRHNVYDERYEDFDVHHTEEVIDRLGNTTVYGYDERGRVTLEVRPDASCTKYFYEQYSFDYNDGENLYDDAEVYENRHPDKPCVIEDSAGNSTYYQYDSLGRTTKIIDPEYNVTEYRYDENSNLTQQKNKRIISFNPSIGQLEYEIFSVTENVYYYRRDYDGELNLEWDGELTNLLAYSEILDAEGNVVDKTEYVYCNNTSNISEVIKYYDPAGGPSDYDVVTSYDYNETESGSIDQPYKVSQPHYSSVDPDWTNYFKYDYRGNQIASWYEWIDPDDPETILYVFTVNEYDGQDRVIRTWRVVDDQEPYDPNTCISAVILSETVYNSVGKVDYSIDENGLLTKYEYDQAGNLVETRVYENYDSYDAEALPLTISRTLYDEEGRAIVSAGPYDAVDANLPVGTVTIYDSAGRVIETQRFSDVEIFIEDVNNIHKQVVGKETTDWEKGELLSYEKTIYDSAGRVALTITLDDEGFEQPTGYKYDAAGKQIAIADANDYALDKTEEYTENTETGFFEITDIEDLLDDDIETYNYVSTTEYEGNRRKSVTDDRGFTTEFEYDALNRVIKTIHPDSVVEEGGPNLVPTYTHVGYDTLGRKVWESNPVIYSDVEDVPDSEIKIYQYNAAGRLITVVLPEVADPENGGQPANPVYDYYYDEHGNLIGILDAKDMLTVFKYNELGQQTAKYQPFKLNNPNRETLDVYYELSQQSPQPKAATQKYDVLGRVTKSTDYKGQVISYEEYDHHGQFKYEKYYVDDDNYIANNPENVIEYTYDNLDRKKQVIVDSAIEQEFYYDTEGRIQAVYSPQGYIRYEYSDITGSKVETRTYSPSADLQNDVLAASNNDNTRVEYTYDILGRLWETVVIKRDGEELAAAEVTTSFYNAAGSRDLQILPNDVNSVYEYDPLNRLTNISHLDTSQQVLSSFVYSVTADGMRKEVSEQVKQPDSSVENHYITYTYDNLNRLTAEENYDNEQPLSANGYAAEYVYDLVGNRLQRTITVNGQSPSLTTTYDYNDNTDRLETEVHVGPVFGMELDDKRYFAYAQVGGGYKYKVAGSNKNIGSIAAYWLGLPSVGAKYIFYAVLILVPVVFFIPVIIRFYRKMGNSDSDDEPAVIRLSLFKRCLCVLLSYMMLLTPGFLESLAEGAISYDEIDTCHWSEGDTTIEYTYDDNGSVTAKITKVTSTQAEIERVVYEYNLQNRLNKVKTSTDGGSTWDTITEYKYNPDGIRVQKIVNSTIVTDYLINTYNHTGYAQVLEETTDNGQDVETITYTIGDDVITQSDGTDIEHLLYDGRGSTRQLIEPDLTISDTFSYDAYGVMLGGNPQTSSGTNLLYAGEYFDTSNQSYYLRARWYDSLNGRFNRMDDFSGNYSDPQSLHKYLYCHNNPINNTDPSGMFISAGIGFALTTLSVVGIVATVTSFALKAFSIGMGFVQLKALGDFMIELNRAPIPDLITKLQIRSLVYLMASDILKNVFGLSLQIVRDGLLIIAFSILLRATIGFLRCMKNAAKLAHSARAQASITDPSRLLPAPKMHKHHIFPKQFKKFFKKAEIKISKYNVEIEQTTHLRGVHGKGMGSLLGRWNPTWKKFFDTYHDPSALQIFQQAGKMMDEFGLSDLTIVPLK